MTKTTEDGHWQDQYISFNEDNEEFICWDERGDYVGRADTIEQARIVIDDYVEAHCRR